MTAGKTDFEWAMAIFDECARAILGDAGMWVDEINHPSCRRILWPLPQPARPPEVLAHWLGNGVVQHVLDHIAEAHGQEAADTVAADPQQMQLVLRMTKRVVDATYARALAEIGPGRLSGLREFKKRWAEAAAERAISAGGNRRAAQAAAGISKSAAARARKRSLKRARSRDPNR